VLSTLTTADTGGGPMLLYPFKRSKLTRPFVSVPAEETLFLFDILRFAPPVPAVVDAMLAHNRQLFEQARAVGGKHYPISSIPLTPADWVLHYGASWPVFYARKLAYDPNFVLTPGQGIFAGT
jgi:FAD/FMN-containing dehydrogenase